MSERLVLVERFEELKVSSLVVIKYCATCGSDHRGQLIAAVDSAFQCGRHGFEVAPLPRCLRSIHQSHICRCSVEGRQVYLVDTGLESTDATTTTAPRKLETVR